MGRGHGSRRGLGGWGEFGDQTALVLRRQVLISRFNLQSCSFCLFTNVENAFRSFSLHNMTGLHAPQNVKVYSTCSTCLRATWDPVIVPIHENPLTGYRLVCRQEVSEKTITKFVGPTQSSANLKSLQKFSSYTITVSSMAKSELGDPSEPVTVTTLEDGKAVI